jgi:hypothetical protein
LLGGMGSDRSRLVRKPLLGNNGVRPLSTIQSSPGPLGR